MTTMIGRILSFLGLKKKKKKKRRKQDYEVLHPSEAKEIDNKIKKELATLRAEVAYWKSQFEKLKNELNKISVSEYSPAQSSISDPRVRRMIKKAAMQDYIRFREGTFSLTELVRLSKEKKIKVFTVDHRFLGYLEDIIVTSDPFARIGIVVRRGKKRYLVASASKIHDLIHRPENTEILKHGVLILQRTWEGDTEPYIGRIEVEIDQDAFMERLFKLEENLTKSDTLKYGDIMEFIHEYVFKEIFEKGKDPDEVAHNLSKKLFDSDVVIPQVRKMVYDARNNIIEAMREIEKEQEKPQEEEKAEEQKVDTGVKIPLPKLEDEDWEEQIGVKSGSDAVEEIPDHAEETLELETEAEEYAPQEEHEEEHAEEGNAEDEIERLFRELSEGGGEGESDEHR